jgi:hypothetical protein
MRWALFEDSPLLLIRAPYTAADGGALASSQADQSLNATLEAGAERSNTTRVAC